MPEAAVLDTFPQTEDRCHDALQQTLTSAISDRRKHLAYAFLNAARAFDELKRLRKDQGGLGLSFAGFEAELDGSQSADEFSTRLRDKLKEEKLVESESDAKMFLRSELTDGQLQAFTTCMLSRFGESFVALMPGYADKDGVIVSMAYNFGNAPPEPARLICLNGSARADTELPKYGRGRTSFVVIPDKDTTKVQVTVNLGNAAAQTVVVPIPSPPLLPPEPTRPELDPQRAPWATWPLFAGNLEGELLDLKDDQIVGWAWDRDNRTARLRVNVFATSEQGTHSLVATEIADEEVARDIEQKSDHGFRVSLLRRGLRRGEKYLITVVTHGTRNGLGTRLYTAA
ncbi:MAG: hypothetical protein JSR59_01070 [Proteobacteria bacterium]|nr:hypothetical protein [Pseudomonadota bacterium]